MRGCAIVLSCLLFCCGSTGAVINNIAFTALDQLVNGGKNKSKKIFQQGEHFFGFSQGEKFSINQIVGRYDENDDDDQDEDDENGSNSSIDEDNFENQDLEVHDSNDDQNYDENDGDQSSENSTGKKSFGQDRLSLASTDAFFPDHKIVRAAISENGTLAALSYRDGTVGIKNLKTGRMSVIQADNFGGVRSMHFAGNNHVLYTYSDTEKHKHLMVIRLNNKVFQEITPVPDSQHIRVYGKGHRILIHSPTKDKHFLHMLDTAKLDQNISENSQKRALKEIVSSKDPIDNVIFNTETQSFIYVTGTGRNQKLWRCERNGKPVQVKSPGKTDRYISLANNGVIYKVASGKIYAIKKGGASVQVGNTREGEINVDSAGIPYLLTSQGIRTKNSSIGSTFNVGKKKYSTPAVINAINRSLGDRSWSIVDTAFNNRYWLIKSTHPVQPTRYFRIDLMNSASSSAIDTEENTVVHEVVSISIPARKGYKEPEISGFVTFPSRYSKKTPVILCLRRSNDKFFSWEYDPQAQYLADRGFIVVSINQNCDEKGRSVVVSEVTRALNWLGSEHKIRNNFWNAIKTVPTVGFDKVILVSNCKNANGLMRKLSSQNFRDREGRELAGVCFVNPEMPKNSSKGFQLPTMILPSIIDSEKSTPEGHNTSVFSLLSSEDETRALLIYAFATKAMDLRCSEDQIDTQKLQIHSDELKLLPENS